MTHEIVEPTGPQRVRYRHQRDLRYERFVQLGISKVPLGESGLCWLACFDMALSPFVTGDDERLKMLVDLALRLRPRVQFDAMGGLPFAYGYLEAAAALAEIFRDTTPLEVELLYDDYTNPWECPPFLEKGGLVIFHSGVGPFGHSMLMDGVIGSSDMAIRYLNPTAESAGKSVGYLTYSDLHERRVKDLPSLKDYWIKYPMIGINGRPT